MLLNAKFMDIAHQMVEHSYSRDVPGQYRARRFSYRLNTWRSQTMLLMEILMELVIQT
jgi:hypothetical protein